MNAKGGIYFGALVPPLSKQLGVSAKTLTAQQTDADAITRLVVRGLLTDAEAHRARKRLLRDIESVLEKR